MEVSKTRTEGKRMVEDSKMDRRIDGRRMRCRQDEVQAGAGRRMETRIS